MGNLFRIIGLLIVTLMVSFGLSAGINPQDPVKKTENKRHIKMLKIVNGKKIELDTVVFNNEPFIWKGDTINGKSNWAISKSKKGLRPGVEESESVYEYSVAGDKGGKKMIIVTCDENSPLILHDLQEKTDSAKKIIIHSHSGKSGPAKIMMFDGDREGEIFAVPIPPVPPVPLVPPVPATSWGYSHSSSNVIDLSDPGIISYKKKKMKDGTEKIEIVRKQVKEVESAGFRTFGVATPGHTGTLKVIKEGEGPATIIH